MTPQTIESLMTEIEAEDSIDFATLRLDENVARSLMANHFCDVDDRLRAQGLSAEERLEVMAAIAAHTMTENMVLHIQRLRHADDPADFRAWMQRHGLG